MLPLAVLAATGWLYLVRDSALLALGPKVSGALPLQQLAGNDAQPLLAVALAWVPAGVVAAVALARTTRLSPQARAAWVAVSVFVLLVLTGAEADTVALNDPPFTHHITGQAHRAATFVAPALSLVGALMVRRRRAAA